MSTDTFSASVQYNDFTGTAAADRSGQVTPEQWLKNNGKMGDSDFLVGISVWTGEHHGKYNDPLSVEFVIASGYHDSVKTEISTGNPLSVRSISLQMPVAEFLGLFKRFSLTLSNHGMLEGREVQRTEV